MRRGDRVEAVDLHLCPNHDRETCIGNREREKGDREDSRKRKVLPLICVTF